VYCFSFWCQSFLRNYLFSAGLCLQMFSNDLSLGNIIVRFNQGKPQIDNKWYTPCWTLYKFKYTCMPSFLLIDRKVCLPLKLNSI
jgi:hypothetical protein